MRLKIKSIRDGNGDFAIIMMYSSSFLHRDLEFLSRPICQSLLAVWDDEHAIRLEEYVHPQEKQCRPSLTTLDMYHQPITMSCNTIIFNI